MPKFRLVSKSGDGIGLAHRIAQEGHDIDFWLEDEHGPKLYQGILPRIADWRKGLTKDTILVFDMCENGREAEEMKKQGYRIFGASVIADQLELDRAFGLDVAGNAGIEVPFSEDFQDYEKAKQFLEKQDEDTGWVFKAEKNREGIRSFKSTDRDEMLAMLDHYSEIWIEGVDFILQQVVEGVEISSEAWFINGEYIPNSYNNTLEEKRFANDDLSVYTGCSSSLVKFNLCPDLYDELFGKLAPWLKLHKYTGPLDINCIISEDGVPNFLEYTSRCGYSAIYAFCEILGMPISEFIESIASGIVPELEPYGDWAGSLRISTAPYPFDEEAPEAEGIPVRGIDDFDHIFPLDVYMHKGKLVCSGFDGIICEVTGSHSSFEVLWDEIYDRASLLMIPGKMYRTDIKESAAERLNQLSLVGFCDESYNDIYGTMG